MPKYSFLSFTTLSVSLLALAGCETSLKARPVADLPPGVEGIWQSNGYGYVLDASDEYPRLFHHTPDFCIEDAGTAAILSHYLTPDNLAYDGGGLEISFSDALEDYPELAQAIRNELFGPEDIPEIIRAYNDWYEEQRQGMRP